jgi:uncharacterized protein YbjT (DUF2867 family)
MESASTHPLKRILILGASGQLGSLLHEHLFVQYPEAEVIGCVRNTNIHSSNFLAFNPFTDKWQQLGKADVLINSIGIIRETPEISFEKTHVGITQLILENRLIIGNPRIIQISALGADENSPISFLQTKGKADQLLLGHTDTVVVRPSIVCTPNTMLVQKLRLLGRISRFLHGYLPFPELLLNTRIQPIMPADLAAIIEKICFLKNPPAHIYAVGPSPLSLQHLIEVSSGCQTKFIKLPQSLSDRLAGVVSLIFPAILSKEQYQLLQKDNTYSGTEAANLLKRKLLSTESFWQKGIA